MVEVNHMEKIF